MRATKCSRCRLSSQDFEAIFGLDADAESAELNSPMPKSTPMPMRHGQIGECCETRLPFSLWNQPKIVFVMRTADGSSHDLWTLACVCRVLCVRLPSDNSNRFGSTGDALSGGHVAQGSAAAT